MCVCICCRDVHRWSNVCIYVMRCVIVRQQWRRTRHRRRQHVSFDSGSQRFFWTVRFVYNNGALRSLCLRIFGQVYIGECHAMKIWLGLWNVTRDDSARVKYRSLSDKLFVKFLRNIIIKIWNRPPRDFGRQMDQFRSVGIYNKYLILFQ